MLGLSHVFLAGAEDTVGQFDLARVNSPLAFAAERGRPVGIRRVSIGIRKITERTIDRPKPVLARGNNHFRDRVMPHVAPMDVAIAVLVREIVAQMAAVNRHTFTPG